MLRWLRIDLIQGCSEGLKLKLLPSSSLGRAQCGEQLEALLFLFLGSCRVSGVLPALVPFVFAFVLT